jgi:O-antigen/teichoic acid export membrane protein
VSDATARPSDSGLIRSGVAWKIFAGVVTQVARVLFAFLLARFLTPSEYGLAGMALVVSGFVLAFSDLALGAALVQRKEITEAHRSTTFWITLAAGLLLTLLGIGASGLAAAAFGQPEVRDLFAVMSLTFVITSLSATQSALLMRSMDFRALELRIVIGTIVGGMVGVAAAVAGWGAWAIVLQQVTLSVVSTVLLWVATPWRPRFLVSMESLRDLGGYSASLLGNRLAYVAHETTTPLLIGRLLGAASLGLYVLAYNIVITPISRLTLPLGEVLFPAFSRRQDDYSEVGGLWRKALYLSAAVTLPALAGLVVVAPDFVPVTLGERWNDAVPVIQILVWVAALRALQGPSTSVVLGIGRADALFMYSIVYFAATIAAIVVGSHWGIEGVSYGIAFGTMALSVYWTYWVARQVGVSLRFLWAPLSGVVQATAIMTLATFGVREALVSAGTAAAARLAVCIAVGTAVYVLAARWRAPDVFAQLRELLRRRGASSPVPAAGPRASEVS